MNSKINILFVEDDPFLSFVVKDNLEEAGYFVNWCSNGEQACDKYKRDQYDLCVLDIMLPKKDGFSVAEFIREENKNVPILFLSAKALEEDRIRGFKVGGDDYLTKPFSIEELLLRIRAILRRTKVDSEHKHIFYIGDYIFDHLNLSLQYQQDVQKLTQREADLLRFVFINQNRLIRREEILKNIWGDDDYFMGRSMDVFISRIRKYLSKDASIKLRNHHGVGFWFSTI